MMFGALQSGTLEGKLPSGLMHSVDVMGGGGDYRMSKPGQEPVVTDWQTLIPLFLSIQLFTALCLHLTTNLPD